MERFYFKYGYVIILSRYMPVYKHIDKNFFKKWGGDMAYILGFMYADGNIIINKRGAHFFAIYSSDKKLIQEMLKCMESEHKLSERKKFGDVSYSFQVGSKEMYFDLIKIGLVPNKSKRMQLPKIPKEYFADFIRGYFDGDGSVWMGQIHKESKVPVYTVRTTFTSASIGFLSSIYKSLQMFGIKGGAIHTAKNGNYGRLVFGAGDSLKLSKIMYNGGNKLFLNRKKLIFEKFAAVAQR